MTNYEIEAVLSQYNKQYQERWEQVRWLGFINAQVYGAKVKKPQDLIRFSWEHEEALIDKPTPEQLEQFRNSQMQTLKNAEEGKATIVKI